jgi:hypothetical protein
MSDPQDLLYTNKYIDTQNLSNQNLIDTTKYYERFERFIDDNKVSDIEVYQNSNLHEQDEINKDKNKNTKWPPGNNKNQYPLFDSLINDVSVNRYKKEKITKVSINSKNRNIGKYLFPNNFSIDLTRVFSNIKKFVINDVIIPNCSQSVNKFNNNLSWQYATEITLVSQNIDAYIIPTPDPKRKILYSSLPYSVVKNIDNIYDQTLYIENYLVYQANIVPGYYSVDVLISTMRVGTSSVLHKNSSGYIEEPYASFPNLQNTPTQMTMRINPNNSIVEFVNRMEEIQIQAIQTFSPYPHEYSNIDIFYPYSDTKNDNLDSDLIYITVTAINGITNNYYSNSNNPFSPSAFPLVITGLNYDIGGISSTLYNYTEFYDLDIYLQNNLYNENELDSVCTYKYIDKITITKDGITQNYLRFGLKLSNGNLNGITYNYGGYKIKPIKSSNIIYNSSLNTFLSSSIIDYQYLPGSFPFIGRALLFRWIYDLNNGQYVNYETSTQNEKKRTILRMLAFPIPNQTYDIVNLTTNNGFRFVQTNFQGYLVNKDNLDVFNVSANNFNTPIPSRNLSLQFYNNNYYFLSDTYIYLKIDFGVNSQLLPREDVLNASDQIPLQYNQNYVDGYFFDVGIGQDYTCINDVNNTLDILTKDQTNIFAKIILSTVPTNTDNVSANLILNNNFSINYDSTFDNIENINISVYDENLKLFTMTRDWSFTLNIHEIKDVLKETLINTKTNSVNSTGNYI